MNVIPDRRTHIIMGSSGSINRCGYLSHLMEPEEWLVMIQEEYKNTLKDAALSRFAK